MQPRQNTAAACHAKWQTCRRDILTTTARASNNRFKRVFFHALANRPHAQIRARTAHEKRQKAVLSIIRSYYIQQASQYKRVTSVLCLFWLFITIIDRLPFATPGRYAVVSRILYINFFLIFFIFHFCVQSHTEVMPILPIYLPHNRSKYFLCTISHPR